MSCLGGVYGHIWANRSIKNHMKSDRRPCSADVRPFAPLGCSGLEAALAEAVVLVPVRDPVLM